MSPVEEDFSRRVYLEPIEKAFMSGSFRNGREGDFRGKIELGPAVATK